MARTHRTARRRGDDVTSLSRDDARRFLVGHLGLRAAVGEGVDATRAVLRRLGYIQLDPLDPIGTNADLVAMARVDGLSRGDVYRALLPGYAFEHFAKERCLIRADWFPRWRDAAALPSWWRSSDRARRLPGTLLDDVLAEVRERGPIGIGALQSRGTTDPIDWSGWKGTAKVEKLAVEALWAQCRVVVVGRAGRGDKLVDVPERALPDHHAAPSPGVWPDVAIEGRVEACGLLADAAGITWSTLADGRTAAGALADAGAVERVTVDGSDRVYFAPLGFRDVRHPDDDGRMRILGPLDPLLWDRRLVAQVFGFEYVWEVYKPASQRKYGWYVVPLLFDGLLVGRLEARVRDGSLVVDRLWKEEGRPFSDVAYREALERHAAALGVGLG
jgi:uncharacterized protein YcaQ